MIKMPKDLTRAERGVTNRSSDYFVDDFIVVCVIMIVLFVFVPVVVCYQQLPPVCRRPRQDTLTRLIAGFWVQLLQLVNCLFFGSKTKCNTLFGPTRQGFFLSDHSSINFIMPIIGTNVPPIIAAISKPSRVEFIAQNVSSTMSHIRTYINILDGLM